MGLYYSVVLDKAWNLPICWHSLNKGMFLNYCCENSVLVQKKIIFWLGKSFFTTIILLPFYGRVFTAVNGKKIEVGKFCRKFTVESMGVQRSK